MVQQNIPLITMPLSGRGKPIVFGTNDDGVHWVQWGEVSFLITRDQIRQILSEFFRNHYQWYPLGASMTAPIPGGLGEYVQSQFSPLGPRHASAIAAMMVYEGLLESRGKNPIELRRVILADT